MHLIQYLGWKAEEYTKNLARCRAASEWVDSLLFMAPDNQWIIDAPWHVVRAEATQLVLQINSNACVELIISKSPVDTVWMWRMSDEANLTGEVSRTTPPQLKEFYEEHFKR